MMIQSQTFATPTLIRTEPCSGRSRDRTRFCRATATCALARSTRATRPCRPRRPSRAINTPARPPPRRRRCLLSIQAFSKATPSLCRRPRTFTPSTTRTTRGSRRPAPRPFPRSRTATFRRPRSRPALPAPSPPSPARRQAAPHRPSSLARTTTHPRPPTTAQPAEPPRRPDHPPPTTAAAQVLRLSLLLPRAQTRLSTRTLLATRFSRHNRARARSARGTAPKSPTRFPSARPSRSLISKTTRRKKPQTLSSA